MCFRALLVFSLYLFIAPQANAQRIPDEREIVISFANIPLDSALFLLSSVSNVNIAWDEEILPREKRVSLAANYLKLGLALDNIFVGTSLRYRIIGNQLIIEDRIPPPVIQEKATISGRVTDTDGEYIVYGTIYSNDYIYSTLTNEYGFYSLELPVGPNYTLEYSSVAHEKSIKEISFRQDTVVDVVLSTENFLNEVVIIGEVPKKSKLTEEFDDMPVHLLSSMANLAGEADVIRMAQMRSGVTAQADGFGGLQVRGGSVDQNLILLDGVPVYNTGHAFGLFSIFNPSVIKSAKLIKGGIPARYGGRLSSVFDVRVKEGSNQTLKGDFSISPLIARASLEGPIAKGKSSFLISGRRTIVDPWLKPLSSYQFDRNNEEGQINFFFYDINAKVNFDLGEKDQVFLSGYIGKDVYDNEVFGGLETTSGDLIEELNRDNQNWGNQIGTLRWTHQFTGKLFSTASLSYTNFGFEDFEFDRTIINPDLVSPSLSYGASLFSSKIADQIASYDVEWYANKFYHLRVGANYTRHELTPGTIFSQTTDGLLDADNNLSKETIQSNDAFGALNGREFRAYAENEVKFGNKIALNLGVHYSSIDTDGESYKSIQPRLSAKYNVSLNTSLKFGYSKMDQYFHLLTSSGLGLPSDVWLPSTASIAPEASEQFSASFKTQITKGLDVSVGAYTKNYSNITGAITGAPFNITSTTDWERNIPVGVGESRGIEVELSKSTGRILGWVNYTYGESTRTFPTINDGETFRANANRTHMLNISLIGRINDNIELSSAWVYGSSAPTTTPTSILSIPVNGDIIFLPLFTRINNDALPTYHRLDVGVNFYNELSWGRQRLSFGAYNAYGRDNPFFVDLVQDRNGGTPSLEQVSLIPFLPYVSIGISF